MQGGKTTCAHASSVNCRVDAKPIMSSRVRGKRGKIKKSFCYAFDWSTLLSGRPPRLRVTQPSSFFSLNFFFIPLLRSIAGIQAIYTYMCIIQWYYQCIRFLFDQQTCAYCDILYACFFLFFAFLSSSTEALYPLGSHSWYSCGISTTSGNIEIR